MDIQTIFEKSFDYDTYIENWLLSIKDIKERTFARKYLADSLRAMMQESEKNYRNLEDRVYAEVNEVSNRHSIYITVVARDKFDITNGSWFPMLEGDEKPLQEQKGGTLPEILPITLERRFFTGSADEIFRLEEIINTDYTGLLKTKKNEYEAIFRLIPTTEYRTCVTYMYSLFQSNAIPWTTISCGYLMRFFSVQVTEIRGAWKPNEEITGYDVSFGNFDTKLQSGYFPVWNVSKIQYDSNQFVIPVIDTKYYEHTFPMDQFGIMDGYLLISNQSITSFRQTENEIRIFTTEETFQRWNAYRIIKKPPLDLYCFEIPILSNCPKDSFVFRFSQKHNILLQSRLTMIRCVNQFDIQEYLELTDVVLITDTTEEYDDTYISVMNVSPIPESEKEYIRFHNLNWFIQDDFVNHSEQKVLLFRFRIKKQHYICYDLVCFVISEMQRHFIEYRCEAAMEEAETE